ncbi:MAG: hypothetical protein AB8C84_10110 [Oligoflexales bacterium]
MWSVLQRFFFIVLLWNDFLYAGSALIMDAEKPQGELLLQHILGAEKSQDTWSQKPKGVIGVKWFVPLLNPDFQIQGSLKGAKSPETTVVEQVDSSIELDYLIFKNSKRRVEAFAHGVYPAGKKPSYGFLGLKMPVRVESSSSIGVWKVASRTSLYGLFVGSALDETLEMRASPDDESFVFQAPVYSMQTPAGFASYGVELNWNPVFLKSFSLGAETLFWRGWLPFQSGGEGVRYQNVSRTVAGAKVVWNLHKEVSLETEVRSFWDGFYAKTGGPNLPQYETRMNLVTKLF